MTNGENSIRRPLRPIFVGTEGQPATAGEDKVL